MANITEFERQCYGMTTQAIREQYMEGITARISGLEMVVMGMLSDCQHMLEYGMSQEDIRITLNRAKFILGEMMAEREAKV
jgi:hypothetical protein